MDLVIDPAFLPATLTAPMSDDEFLTVSGDGSLTGFVPEHAPAWGPLS